MDTPAIDPNKLRDLKIRIIGLAKVLAETLQETATDTPPAIGVASGYLYAAVMGHGYTLPEYQLSLEVLKTKKLVTEQNHLLTWIGGTTPLKDIFGF